MHVRVFVIIGLHILIAGSVFYSNVFSSMRMFDSLIVTIVETTSMENDSTQYLE